MTKAAKTIKALKERRARRKPEAKVERREHHDIVHRQTSRYQDMKHLTERRREIAPQLADAERVLMSPYLDAQSFENVTRQTVAPLTAEMQSIDERLRTNLRDYQTEHPQMEGKAGEIYTRETELNGNVWNQRRELDYWRRATNADIHMNRTKELGIAWDDNQRRIVDFGGPVPEDVPLYR